MMPGINVLLMCTAVVSFSLALQAAQEPTEQKFEATADEKAIVELTNKERQKEGLDALQMDPTLFRAARMHSANMARQQKLSHELDGKGPSDRITELGYKFFAVGENVAWNDATPAAVVDAWMKSPFHRANILRKDFTQIGVGVARDGKDQPYYTQVFARPQSAGATVSARFTLINDSVGDAIVTLPGDSPESTLKPGEHAVFGMSGSGELSQITVTVGETPQKLDVKDGATYRIQSGAVGIFVSIQTPAEEAR